MKRPVSFEHNAGLFDTGLLLSITTSFFLEYRNNYVDMLKLLWYDACSFEFSSLFLL